MNKLLGLLLTSIFVFVLVCLLLAHVGRTARERGVLEQDVACSPRRFIGFGENGKPVCL